RDDRDIASRFRYHGGYTTKHRRITMPDDNHNAEEHCKQRSRKATRRKPRRATAPATGPTTANGPEPRMDAGRSKPRSGKKLTERDRWLLEQNPPHFYLHTIPDWAVAPACTGKSCSPTGNASVSAAKNSWSKTGVISVGTLALSVGNMAKNRS